MKHLPTYMLLVMGGNPAPTKEDIVTGALAKVGVEIDEVRSDRLLEVLRDVDHDDLNALLETGKGSLARFGTPAVTKTSGGTPRGGGRSSVLSYYHLEVPVSFLLPVFLRVLSKCAILLSRAYHL
jgi:ribosomal protein L12E/L44/L45/RPP1/RPP2